MGVYEKDGKFYPDPAFSEKAWIKSFDQYQEIYQKSVQEPERFWKDVSEELVWFKKPDSILKYNFDIRKGRVFHEWFKGGYTNVCYNCLDRYLDTEIRNKAAIIWQGEPDGDTKVLTYLTLHREVCRFANVLKKKGLKKGDRVTIYLPMVWQLPVAMLACARLGLPHNVVFGGFSAEALMHRIQESESRLLVTVDQSLRGGKTFDLKENADEALKHCPTVEHVIVVKRTGGSIPWTDTRDTWWNDEVSAEDIDDYCEYEHMEAEDILYILYTSGSTGKPKGQVHTTGGYMTYVYLTQKLIFDLHPETLYWCMADIGWVTGHSYIVYGPLLCGTTSFMYEGTPLYPKPDRAWELIDRYKINVCYTAPTAIRALSRQGDHWPENRDLSSLRVLGTVGEPINPEAWMWYHEKVGKENCPIVDTWWQTETGGILISPLPGAWPTKPGSATFPFPGIVPRVANPGIENPDERGERMPSNETGHLCIEKPWPGLSRTIYKDHERYEQTYFAQYPGMYFTGDGCFVDPEGYHFLQGRVDDVINVSGHRISTAEVESALVLHTGVAEAAVAGMPHEIKGQGIYAFVTLKLGVESSEELKTELIQHVRKEIGAIATPDKLHFANALPKTRSGKIMRRILRKIAENKANDLGDISTLEDSAVIKQLIESRKD
ncbi:MAG: acetate--CoA ligase [Deltaproteobacteria bacterium]|nr:acetate--CoA ligase [Deltaproteobacteria bacterium]MBW1992937.1 acetate--CoA ligase [Deltaproteobacteria bacterium]MBW2152807.1 acetate--CoA ligase [Deltaproteobacteria bacterium]